MPQESSKIETYLNSVRSEITRVNPQEAFSRKLNNEGTVIIDTRPASYRAEEGRIPDAIIIERNVLEWRLDPTSPNCIPQARHKSFTPIIMCNEGYASSLAVKTLMELGVSSAADLEGGFRAWKAEGLPVLP